MAKKKEKNINQQIDQLAEQVAGLLLRQVQFEERSQKEKSKKDHEQRINGKKR